MMATQGRSLGLGALAVAATAWLMGGAATMAGDGPPPLQPHLLASDAEIRVAADEARVVLRQDYRLPADAPAGGMALVPLPPAAAVEQVRLLVSGRARPVSGRLGAQGLAVEIPAMPADRRFTVEVVYLQHPRLGAEGGSRLVLPTPARDAGNEAAFTVTAVLAEPMLSVDSPSHRIVGTATDGGGTWLTLRDGAVPADRPFVLEWSPAQVASDS